MANISTHSTTTVTVFDARFRSELKFCEKIWLIFGELRVNSIKIEVQIGLYRCWWIKEEKFGFVWVRCFVAHHRSMLGHKSTFPTLFQLQTNSVYGHHLFSELTKKRK